MKKLLLSVLLLFVVCNGCYAAERIVVLSSNLKGVQSIGTELIQVVLDKQTGVQYLIVATDGYKSGGVAVTPLIKPAVYVHKGGKR